MKNKTLKTDKTKAECKSNDSVSSAFINDRYSHMKHEEKMTIYDWLQISYGLFIGCLIWIVIINIMFLFVKLLDWDLILFGIGLPSLLVGQYLMHKFPKWIGL